MTIDCFPLNDLYLKTDKFCPAKNWYQNRGPDLTFNSGGMKIPVVHKDANQPHASQLQNDMASTNKRSFICFSSISRVTMGTLQLVVFPGSERSGKKEKKNPSAQWFLILDLKAVIFSKPYF